MPAAQRRRGKLPNLPARIVLIGFMGSGKSTVGRLLAARLGRPFIDLDRLIEERSGKTVREIFDFEGEEAFRRRERSALLSLRELRKAVIAAGGGAPMREENREFFQQGSITFYLEVSFEEFLRRTAANPVRPLVRKPIEELRALYEQRLPVYRSLGRRVLTDGKNPQEILEEILNLLASPTG